MKKLKDTPCVCAMAQIPVFDELEAKAPVDADLMPGGEVDPDAVARILSAPVVPSQLSERTRLQLAQIAEAGGILALPIPAYVYADKPNAADWRLASKLVDKRAKEVAKASPPVRMMLDHGTRASDRIGDWLSAETEDIKGVKWVHMQGVIRRPSAQAEYLRGNLDRFSVGVYSDGTPYTCSICGAAYERAYGMMWPSCEHFPGQEYEGVRCELITSGYFGEASFVFEGAVSGTRIGSLAVEEEEVLRKPEESVSVNTPEVAEEIETMEASAVEAQAAEAVAKAAAALEQERQARIAAEAQVCELTLAQYVAQRKIFPAEVEYYRKIWKDSGKAAAEAQLALRPSLVLPVQDTPAPQSPEPSKGHVGSLEKCKAGAERARRLGFLGNTPTEDHIKALGLDRMNWS